MRARRARGIKERTRRYSARAGGDLYANLRKPASEEWEAFREPYEALRARLHQRSASFSACTSLACTSWRSMPMKMETRLIASQTIAPTDT